MKKLLSILSLLCLTLSGFAQTTEQVPFYIREVGLSTNLYRVTATRNLSTYPYTKQGNIDFRNAVTLGQIERVTDDGCIIPVGQRAPLQKPTCTVIAGPSYSSGARYSYQTFNGRPLLTVDATVSVNSGDNVKMRFENADGTAFTTNNPDGVAINSSDYYYGAEPSGTYNRRWQLYLDNASPKKITIRRESDQSVYSKTFALTLGESNVSLWGSGTIEQPTCNVTLAVNSPSVGCGGTATLTVNASGSDASGLQYNWTGPNGYTASGASISVAMAQSNGSYQYTVTGSKSGCSASAMSTVTVSGCVSTTVTSPGSGYYSYRGDTYDYPSWPSASTDNKFPVFENEFIKIQLALDNQKGYSQTPGGGGAIWKLWNKKGNVNHTLLYNPNRYNGDDNGPVNRSGFPNRIFWGQGLSDCLYKLPKPFYTDESNGAAGPSHDTGLGLNPNECGDDMLNSGELQEYHIAPGGQGFHNKTRPPIYGQNRFYLPVSAITMEKWVRLEGRALKLNYQANFNQQGDAEYANSRVVTKPQETPCVYVNGLNIFKWYDGTNPYSNDGITTIEARLSSNNANNFEWNGGRIGGQFLSEPWIWVGGKDGYGIGLMLKHNYEAAYAYRGDGGFFADNPHMGGSYATITASPQEILDHVMKYRHEAEVIVGTVDEVRQYVYSHSFRPDFTPRFKWNRAGREGWFLNSGDAPDIHTWDDGYNGTAKDGWKVYFAAGPDAVMSSPGVIWKADQTQTIYLKYKYSGKETQWGLTFQRNAQTPNGEPNLDANSNRYANEDAIRYRNGRGNGDNQTVKFEVIPDGQVHTAVINLPSTWQGVINRINIRPHVNGSQFQSGESATLYWMNNQNADPFPN